MVPTRNSTRSTVGWVECSDTHHVRSIAEMTYQICHWVYSGTISLFKDGVLMKLEIGALLRIESPAGSTTL